MEHFCERPMDPENLVHTKKTPVQRSDSQSTSKDEKKNLQNKEDQE